MKLREIILQINIYKDALTFGGLSKSSAGQSARLQTVMAELYDYEDDINASYSQNPDITVYELDYKTYYDDLIEAVQLLEGGEYLTPDPPVTAQDRLTPKYSKNIEDYQLPVLRVKENLTTYSTKSVPPELRRTIVAGQVIKVYDSQDNYLGSNVIVLENNSLFEVTANGSLVNPAYGVINLWWKLNSNKSEWLDESIFEEAPLNTVASVKAAVRNTNLLGRLGWSLYYQSTTTADEIEVAKGTDGVIPGVCVIAKKNVRFVPGIYTIRIRSTISPVRTVARFFKKWTLESPTDLLVCTPIELTEFEYES